MGNYRVLIIDDEALARSLLQTYLANNNQVEVVGECANGLEGIRAIQELRPDIVLLDIQMPKINGFEMLELLNGNALPEIIFSTAYDQFAIKAFEMNAVDYLLKPYAEDRLSVALNKAIERLEQRLPAKADIMKLAETPGTCSLDRVVVKSGKKIHILPVEDIHYFEAQDDYVMIYGDKGHFLKQKTMKFYENNLDKTQFVRIHRSFLVNVAFITEIQHYEKESWILILNDGNKLKVSKSGYKILKEVLRF